MWYQNTCRVLRCVLVRQVAFRLDQETIEAIKRHIQHHGITVSIFVRNAVREALRKAPQDRGHRSCEDLEADPGSTRSARHHQEP